MNPKEKDNEIIELTDEELDEIFADDDFDNGEEDAEIRSFYFSNPDPFASSSVRRVTRKPISFVWSLKRILLSTTAAKRMPLFVPKRMEFFSNISETGTGISR